MAAVLMPGLRETSTHHDILAAACIPRPDLQPLGALPAPCLRYFAPSVRSGADAVDLFLDRLDETGTAMASVRIEDIDRQYPRCRERRRLVHFRMEPRTAQGNGPNSVPCRGIQRVARRNEPLRKKKKMPSMTVRPFFLRRSDRLN